MPGQMCPQNWLRPHGSLLPAVLWFAAFCAAAQAPAAKPLPPTPQERALRHGDRRASARRCAEKKIASADAATMTGGLNRALVEIGNKTDATDPRRAAQMFEEAAAVSLRAGLPVAAAADISSQATVMQHYGEIFDSITVLGRGDGDVQSSRCAAWQNRQRLRGSLRRLRPSRRHGRRHRGRRPGPQHLPPGRRRPRRGPRGEWPGQHLRRRRQDFAAAESALEDARCASPVRTTRS